MDFDWQVLMEATIVPPAERLPFGESARPERPSGGRALVDGQEWRVEHAADDAAVTPTAR